MTAFDHSTAPAPVRLEIGASHRAFWQRLAGPGASWTGAQRVEIALEARRARLARANPPWLRGLLTSESDLLPPVALAAIRTIVLDQHRIDRAWARGVIEELGDVAYVELLAVSAQTVAVDAFSEALGVGTEPLPAPRGGAPDAGRPEGLSDIGAFVPVASAFPGPNVGRAMSLAPDDNGTFLGLVGSMYAVSDFGELVWKDRPLSRPQVELVAARVSAINECFY